MRVLGLDPGSRRTGYGVVDKSGNRLTAVAYGCLAPPAQADPLAPGWRSRRRSRGSHRAPRARLRRGRRGVLSRERALDARARQVRGALIVTAVQREAEVHEYSPREIKMSVTGNGGATKDQVGFVVKRLLAHRGAAGGRRDALAGAICHLNRSALAAPRRRTSAARRSKR